MCILLLWILNTPIINIWWILNTPKVAGSSAHRSPVTSSTARLSSPTPHNSCVPPTLTSVCILFYFILIFFCIAQLLLVFVHNLIMLIIHCSHATTNIFNGEQIQPCSIPKFLFHTTMSTLPVPYNKVNINCCFVFVVSIIF